MADSSLIVAGGSNRKRSPMYPALSLPQALQRAQVLHEQFDEHPATMEAAAEAWQMSPTSSGLLQTISALKQFGLLSDEGSKHERSIRLTELALDIFIDEEQSPQRQLLLRQAALTPKIYKELWERFGPRLPLNDAPLKMYLVRQREDGTFNRQYVDSLLADFRQTIDFANLANDDIVDSDEESDESSESSFSSSEAGGMTVQQGPPPPLPSAPFRTNPPSWPTATQLAAGKPASDTLRLPITLPTLKVAWLEVPSNLTAAEFETLKAALELFKPALIASAAVPSPASTAETQFDAQLNNL